MRNDQGYGGIIGLLIVTAIILILTSLYFTGGEDKPAAVTDDTGNSQPQPVASDPEKVNAVNALRVAKTAELKVRLMEVRSAIRGYEALEGRYPASIKELTTTGGMMLKALPQGYAYKYDPASGEVAITREGKVIVQ